MKKQLFIALTCLCMLSCGNPIVGNESVALNTLDSVSIDNQTTLTAATDSTTATVEVFYDGWDGNPSFPAGNKTEDISKLMEYITKHLPNIDQYAGITGKLYVSLNISKTGEVKAASLMKGSNTKLDNAVIEVCKNLPPFTPATVKGKPVGVAVTYKLTFDGKSFN